MPYVQELTNIVVHFCKQLTEGEVTDLLAYSDINNDGEISFDEFCELMHVMTVQEMALHKLQCEARGQSQSLSQEPKPSSPTERYEAHRAAPPPLPKATSRPLSGSPPPLPKATSSPPPLPKHVSNGMDGRMDVPKQGFPGPPPLPGS